MDQRPSWEKLNRERAFAEGACADLLDAIRDTMRRNAGDLSAHRLPELLADAITLLAISSGEAMGCRHRFVKMVRARLHDQHVGRFCVMLDAARHRASETKGTTYEDSQA